MCLASAHLQLGAHACASTSPANVDGLFCRAVYGPVAVRRMPWPARVPYVQGCSRVRPGTPRLHFTPTFPDGRTCELRCGSIRQIYQDTPAVTKREPGTALVWPGNAGATIPISTLPRRRLFHPSSRAIKPASRSSAAVSRSTRVASTCLVGSTRMLNIAFTFDRRMIRTLLASFWTLSAWSFVLPVY